MSARPTRLVWFAASPGAPAALSPRRARGSSSKPSSPPELTPVPGPSRSSDSRSPDSTSLPASSPPPAARASLGLAVERFERLLSTLEPASSADSGVYLSVKQLERFAAVLAADQARWRHLIRHERDTRVYEQIFSDERVNAWLICWSDGHDTGFHDHDESAGGIAVISGCVRDERLAIGSGPAVREVSAGECFNVSATAIHRVLHGGTEPAITIHAYSPPLSRMGSYRVGPGGELERHALSYEQELRAEALAA